MVDSFDELMKSPRERRAMTLVFIFLAGGFLALWILQNVLGIKAESVTIAILLLPLIVYLVASGRISELKTPGGLSASFRDLAGANVLATSATVTPEDVQVPADGEIGIKSVVEVKVPDPSRPLVLLLKLGAGTDHYSRAGLLIAMDTYRQHRNFRFVVIQDAQKNFVGYMQSWAFRALLEKVALGTAFVEVINSGDRDQLLAYPYVVRDTITTDTTNRDALKAMTEKNIEAMVVINDKGMLEGVIEREQVISKLLLSLTD